VTSAGYLRYPHVHGELIVFVAEDDVWLAPAAGGHAWRLSADAAQVSYPRFSPDGTSIAWTSWRDGQPDVYTLATADGSAETRLTYWGDNRTRVTGWTQAGEVLAVSAAGQPENQYSWAYAIPLHGAPPRRLPFGPVSDLALGTAATALLTGRENSEPAFWKRYRGGTAGKLWTAGSSAGPLFTRILADINGQLGSPMLIGDRLFFFSDHEGTGNIYSCALDGTGITRHTDHDGMYARNPSTDGQRIVYHVAGDIWMLDGPDAPEPRKLDITLGSPSASRAPRFITASDHLGSLDCDQTGQASVVEVRGTVHWLTHKDGPARALHVDPDARARLPKVLGDTGRVVWVTDDAERPDALQVVAVSGEPRSVLLTGGLGATVTSLAASPDGATVAAALHDGRLLLVDVSSSVVTELPGSDNGPVEGLSFSPDSAWLAWSHPELSPLRRLRMANVADHFVVEVTDGRFADTDPVFTADGLYLAFLSQRSFDPVYDSQSFDLSFPYGSRPYLVTLDAQTPSPFGPLPGGRPVSQDPEEKTDSAERAVVSVAADGLPSRVVGVPVPEGRYSGLRVVKDGLAWLREPVTGVLGESAASLDDDAPRPALERYDLRKREVTELAGELDWFEVSGDGTRLIVRDRDDLRVMPSDSKDDDDHSSGDVISVDLSRARFQSDPAALWRHAYAEMGRIMRRDFWVPDMCGVDWDGVLRGYRPLLDRIRGANDFTDLLWEVVAELGTSHAYITKSGEDWHFGPGGYGPIAVGQLGADLSRDPAGRWVVDRILPGESSDPRARSPLAAPGVAVQPGDELMAVDGQPVDPVRGPWPLLAGTAGKPVELTIRSAASESRAVVVVPLRDERRLRYQDWVARQRAVVRELSDGRLGYLHIPDMVGEGWAHFHRDLRTEMWFSGLVMDVRGNSGGHISQLVVEKLARRVIAWEMGRGVRPVSYPYEARRGPLVLVSDEFAGSDGDIVTAAIRLLSLGPVIGTRTWGGVIGIEGVPGHELVDGTHMTVPRYAFSFMDYGWSVENYGVEPDVEVLISPDDWAAGRDPQLETAVRLALEALEKQAPAEPPGPSVSHPNKARPPLPPRAGGAA
jgi:tricorn protease